MKAWGITGPDGELKPYAFETKKIAVAHANYLDGYRLKPIHRVVRVNVEVAE